VTPKRGLGSQLNGAMRFEYARRPGGPMGQSRS
jgi:hypothetical protein